MKTAADLSPQATAPMRLRLILFTSNTCLSTVGTGLFLAVSPSYFHTTLGISATRIGFGLGLGAFVGLVVGLWLGRVADYLGAASAMSAISAWRVAGYLGFYYARGFWSFLAVAVLLLAIDRPSMPVNQAAVGEIFDGHSRTRVMAAVRALRNIGFLAGAGLAAGFLAWGDPGTLRLAVLINALSYLPGVGFFWWVGRQIRREPGRRPQGISVLSIVGGPSGLSAATFSACNLVLMCHETVLMTVLPLWALDHTAAPRWTQAALLGVNTTLGIALQFPTTHLVRDTERAIRSLVPTGVLFVAATVCFVVASGPSHSAAALALLIVGTVALSVVEVAHLAAFTELTFALSPPNSPGSYMAFYYLGANAQRAVGPAAATWLTSTFLAPGWLLLGALYIAASLAGGRAARSTALALNGAPK